MADHTIHIDYDKNKNEWFVCRAKEPGGKAKHKIVFDTNNSNQEILVTFDEAVVKPNPVSVPGVTRVIDNPRSDTYVYHVTVDGLTVAEDRTRSAPGIIID